MKQPILPTIFLAVLGAIASTSAAQNNLPDDVRAMAKKVMMPVVLKVPGMDKVKVVQNLKYTKSEDPNVLMDIYVPSDLSENEKRPAVIFLHGGAKTDYTPKDWGVYTSWGRLIAASGYRLHAERLGRLYIMGTPDRCVGIRRRNLYPSAGVSKYIPGKSGRRCPRCH